MYSHPNSFMKVIDYRLNGLKNNCDIKRLIRIFCEQVGYNQHRYNTNYPVGDGFQQTSFF